MKRTRFPTFTVITPSFRQLAWLKLCAASIADQQGVQCEHIVQDAGTGAELEQWAATQPGLQLFVERDAGMYDAVNRGLKRATGDICSYLNCDEQYLPGGLQAVGEYFAEHPEVDVVFGDMVLLDAQGRPTCYRRVVRPRRGHLRMAHLPVGTCATFFRRELVEQGYLFDTSWRCIGDAVWVDRLLSDGIRMAVLPRPISAFAFTGENLSDSPQFSAELARFRSEPAAPPAWHTLPLKLQHRFEKLLAGAYARRNLSTDLYVPGDASQRRHWDVERLGCRWDSAAKAALAGV